MTDESWMEGYGLMEANLRDRDLTPPMKALRGATLRAAMNHLTDAQWSQVVQEALRKRDGWFPVVGELEEYAAALPPPPGVSASVLAMLPAEVREIYLQQQPLGQAGPLTFDETKAALAGVRRKCLESGVELPESPVREMS